MATRRIRPRAARHEIAGRPPLMTAASTARLVMKKPRSGLTMQAEATQLIPDPTEACRPPAHPDGLVSGVVPVCGARGSPFELAFHTNPLPMVIARLVDAQFVEVNDAYCEFSGYSRADMVSGQFSGIQMWRDPSLRQDFLDALALAGWVKDHPMEFVRASGACGQALLTASVFENERGAWITVCVHDITQRLQSEEALRAAEEKFRAAFRNNPVAMKIVGVADDRLSDVNDAFVSLSEYTREEVLSDGFSASQLWVDPAQRTLFLEDVEAQGGAHEYATTMVTRSGVRRDIRMTLSIVVVEGQPSLLSVMRDVTDELRASDAARASDRKFAALFRASIEPTTVTRLADGTVMEVNAALCRVLGYEREEVVGRRVTDLGFYAVPGTREKVLEILSRDGEVRDFETQFRRRDGELIEVVLAFFVFEIDGERLVVGTGKDVTRLRRVEREEREANERLSAAFLASPDAMAIGRMEDGCLIDANDAYCRLAEFDRSEILGQSTSTIGLWSNKDERIAWVSALERQGVVHGFEASLRRRSGEIRHVVMNGALTTLRGSVCVLAAIHDVTDERRRTRQVEHANRRFEAAFLASPDPMSIIRVVDAKVIDVNDVYCRTFGFSREEVVGATMASKGIWTEPGLRARWASATQSLGTLRDFEAVLRTRDGALRECLIDSSIVMVDDDECLMVVVRDVTDARLQQRAASVTAQRSSFLFDSSLDAITVSRLRDGVLLEVNDSFVATTGFDRGQLIGTTWTELGILADREQRERLVEGLRQHGYVKDFPWPINHRDGRRLECLITSYVLRDDETEQLAVSIIRDVTALVQTARELKASRQMLGSVLDSMPVRVFWKDREGRYLGANRLFAQAAGFSQVADLIGKSDVDLPWGREAAKFLDLDRQAMESEHGIPPYEECNPIAGAGYVWQLKSKVPLRDADGKVIGVLCAGTDITALKATRAELERVNASLEIMVDQRTRALVEANTDLSRTMETLERARDDLVESEKLAALGALVAGIAHELNTPIGNALIAATTLDAQMAELASAVSSGLTRSRMDTFLTDGHEGAAIVVGNLERAAQLIRSFKQVAVDRVGAQRRAFNLADVVAETLLTMMPAVRKRRVQVDRDIPPDITMDGYPGAISQMLGNLVENALLHGLPGDMIGVVRVTARLQNGHWVRLSVEDTGSGVPLDVQKRMFEPFFTTRLGSGGSGLGLYIVRNVVGGVLGGKVEVSSTPGVGTTFHVSLPLVAP
jgi:PAS domain S-box-containing protein